MTVLIAFVEVEGKVKSRAVTAAEFVVLGGGGRTLVAIGIIIMVEHEVLNGGFTCNFATLH